MYLLLRSKQMADWSGVFDECGDEDGNWDIRQGSRVSFLKALETSVYTPLVSYFFAVNYILGVGCLGMPFAFLQAGVFLASFLIIACSLISWVTVLWVANAAHWGLRSRALLKGNPFRSPVVPLQSLRTRPSMGTINDQGSRKQRTGAEFGDDVSIARSVSRSSSSTALMNRIEPLADYKSTDPSTEQMSPLRQPRSTRRRESRAREPSGDPESTGEPEVVELVNEFLGENAKVVYQLTLSLLTYTGLVAYTQVFVQSVAFQLWKDFDGMHMLLPTIAFSVLVVPLSCLNLDEQVAGQVFMSILRFVSLLTLLLGLLWAIFEMPTTNPALHSNVDVPLVNWTGFGVMFSTGVFSQLFQHSVPGLMRPLATENKEKVPVIFGCALVTTCALYIAIGLAACWKLGDGIQQSINLNFIGFTWGLSENSRFIGTGRILSFLVVIFPALDTVSIFPLIANTLGSNLNSSFPKLLNAQAKNCYNLVRNCAKENNGVELSQTSGERRAREVLWRLVASVPPIIISVVVKDLNFTLQVAGICGVIVALVIPSLLRIAVISKVQATPEFIELYPHTVFGSDWWTPYFVLLVSGGALGVCVCQLALSLA